MKNLIILLFMIVFSLPTHAAMGWFYTDELRAINDALDREKMDNSRGSYLKFIERTPSGFKVTLTYNCTIFLVNSFSDNIDRSPAVLGNPDIKLRIDKKKSSCKGK